MKKNRKGFTLIELVIVTVILGIMASMAIPFYLKSVETSKAGDAVAIGHMLANSYRMYLVDNPAAGARLTGAITDACNTGACNTGNPPANYGDTTGCRLVRCNYIAKQSWSASAYNFTVNPGVPNIVTVARKTGVSPGTNTNGYNTWGYTFSDMSTGGAGCTATGGSGTLIVPPCPNF